jgi:hypothetical protein
VAYYDIQDMGEIEFNKSQAGKEVTISYYGLGHTLQKISLDTRVPNSGNTNIGGIKTFTDDINVQGKISGNETAPDCDDGGATLNQGTADGKILTFKSTDVAHSITDIAEADTYGYISKAVSAQGGIEIIGLATDGNRPLRLRGISTVPIEIGAAKRSGNGKTLFNDSEQVILFYNNTAIKIRMYGDGRFYCDAGGINTKYSTANVTNPPLKAEITGAFGTPAEVDSGWIGIIDDNGAGTAVYLCVSDGSDWWYESLTKAL